MHQQFLKVYKDIVVEEGPSECHKMQKINYRDKTKPMVGLASFLIDEF